MKRAGERSQLAREDRRMGSAVLPTQPQRRNTPDLEGFLVAVPQHDPPHQAQPPRWRNTAAEHGESAPGWGNISDAAPRLGPAHPARFNLMRVLGQ